MNYLKKCHESFNVTLECDAAEALESIKSNPEVVISGIADRIVAGEMLLYPKEDEHEGGTSVYAGEKSDVVPRYGVPVILFVWGTRAYSTGASYQLSG